MTKKDKRERKNSEEREKMIKKLIDKIKDISAKDFKTATEEVRVYIDNITCN